MGQSKREVTESPIGQGAEEQAAYTLPTTPWGGSPSNVTAKLYQVSGGAYTDVSETCLSGSPSVNGDTIQTPVVQNLAAGHTYRLEIKFTVLGNVLEAYCVIKGER